MTHEEITITITLNTATNSISFGLPQDFLLAQLMLTHALRESVDRELKARQEPAHPGVITQRQGMHFLRNGRS